MAFTLPEVEDEVGVAARAVTEGLVLGAYSFRDFKKADDSHATSRRPRSRSATATCPLPAVAPPSGGSSPTRCASPATWSTRRVGSLTPTVFAERAAERAAAAGLTVEVLEKDEIAALGLGGLLAVNQGSTEPPRLREADVRTRRSRRVDDTIALVGKGITFDSGGLSIKPADGMMTMKSDMAGAAAVIAAMCALPALGARTRAVSFTPMTDNMTGGRRPATRRHLHRATTARRSRCSTPTPRVG